MSQTARIRRVKHSGAAVYLGHASGTEAWSRNPERIVEWLCDGYRFRFNQHRATELVPERVKTGSGWVTVSGDDGKPVMRTFGRDAKHLSDKQARHEHSFLAAIPAMVLQAPAKIENTEWWAAKKRAKTLRSRGMPASRMPGFRSKKRGDMRFSCWHNGGQNATLHRVSRTSAILVIAGQNPPGKHTAPGARREGSRWQLKISIKLSQEIRPYTSVQVDWRRRQAMFVSAPAVRDLSPTGKVVGVDRGITHTLATSDGEFVDLPDMRRLEAERAAYQRRAARSKVVAEAEGRNWRTSKRRREALRQAGKRSAKIAKIRKDVLHKASTSLVTTYDTIILEALQVRSMSARGRGKRGLNRGILAQGWTAFEHMVTYKAAASTAPKTVVSVAAHHTSQRCHVCGVIDAASRESQAVFRCRSCGYRGNADFNAARNIRDRHLVGWASPSGSVTQTLAAPSVEARRGEPKTPALHCA